jgi:electron transfer flavoprotein alpha/beta subunit
MNILVCIKQVPDTNEVRIDHKTGTLIRDGVPSIINPDDKNAIEAALSIKDRYCETARITVLTMGPAQADSALREALAMGCDEAYLVSDRAFGGSDTYATSNILSQAISLLGEFDIIFCGQQAIDGDTAQVGPQLAEKLGIPQITYAGDIQLSNNSVIVKRMLEDGYMDIKAPLPVLITCIKELNSPRYPTARGIFRAYKQNIKVLTNEDLQLDTAVIGLNGSPTNVFRTFTPEAKKGGKMLEGTDCETVSQLLDCLTEKHIL